MKIRIFALAKELDIDSKVLIEYANEAGVSVKNSALASISPEERDLVLKHIEAKKQETEVREEVPVPSTPQRDLAADRVGKVRNIKAMAPRPHGGISAQRSANQRDGGGDDESTTAVVDSEEITAGEQESEIPSESVASTTTDSTEDVETEAEQNEEAEENSSEPGKVQGISKDDYVSGSGMSAVREMRPRGNLPNTTETRKPKKSQKTVTPNIAAVPEFKAPPTSRKKSSDSPAQKPDISFTQDMLKGQSPLSAHLQKATDSKRGKEKDHEKSEKDLRQEARSARHGDSLRRTGRQRPGMQQTERTFNRRRSTRTRKKRTTPIEYTSSAVVELPMTVRSLSEAMGRPAKQIIGILFQAGEMVTMNSSLDEETALEVAIELGVELGFKRERDVESELLTAMTENSEEANLVSRPPVVTILGHVDHGKTSLLDKIRSANVASGESGGITQHIAAYQIRHHGQAVTFVDTPGHAAFGEMRSRGANVTDIVVLVVAADDGVMPQTIESISHAKAAGVPIVVALNKIDLPDINEQKVLQELAAQDILPAEWGGDVEVIRTSAESGQGIDDLLETILLTAELQEYQADSACQAMGVCLEAFRDEGLGPISWLLVQKGVLRIGDVVLCGSAVGRIRTIYDDQNQELQEALPSMPVKVAGLDHVPDAGNHFFVMSSIDEARQVADSRIHTDRTESLSGRGRPRTLDDILAQAASGTVQDLPLIIKADTPGSLEALRGEISKLDHPEVRVEFVHLGVGGINESDVYLASTSGAIIVGFHVIPEERARILAEREGVDIHRFNIIYEVTDTIKRALEGLLPPEEIQVTTGRALVLRVFNTSRFGAIAGCRVLNGTIERNNRVLVIRDQTVLNDYPIASLKREKDDAKEVREGMECGIRLDAFNDVKEGDLFEAFRIDRVDRKLET